MTDRENIKLQELGKIKEKYAVPTEAGSTPDTDYDPHEHRQVPHPTTNFETLVHMIKGAFGTGILAMPEALKNSGILCGFICTLLIGALCTYGLHMLVRTQYILCKRMGVPILTYPDSMKTALLVGPKSLQCWATSSAFLTDFFLVLYQVGVCCVYVIFVAVNLKALVDPVLDKEITIELYVLMLLLPFILIMLIPNLKWLAPFSLFSNIITFVCFGLILYFIFQDLPPISERPLFGTLYAFPLYFGTTLFALEAVGVVISLENNMKTPAGFHSVLNIAMFFITLSYVGMGFLGYWRYGDATESTLTVNLPKGHVITKIVQGLYGLAIFISYGLQGFVPVDILWNTYFARCFPNHVKIAEYGLRICIVLLTFVLATTIPLLGLFISLFGSFCLSALGIAFPAIMEICVFWPDQLGWGKWILWKDIALIIIGVIGLASGSFSALSEIISELTKRHS